VFHEEGAPSLSASEAKNVYRCFGCNASGAVLDWVMRTRVRVCRMRACNTTAQFRRVFRVPSGVINPEEVNDASLYDVIEIAQETRHLADSRLQAKARVGEKICRL